MIDNFYIFLGRSSILIPLGLAIQLPSGSYGRLAPRSSLALQGIDIGGGVIDQDYRGEIKVILMNRNLSKFKAKRGDRICQLIPTRIDYPLLQEVHELPGMTQRNNGGFGSTGK